MNLSNKTIKIKYSQIVLAILFIILFSTIFSFLLLILDASNGAIGYHTVNLVFNIVLIPILALVYLLNYNSNNKLNEILRKSINLNLITTCVLSIILLGISILFFFMPFLIDISFDLVLLPISISQRFLIKLPESNTSDVYVKTFPLFLSLLVGIPLTSVMLYVIFSRLNKFVTISDSELSLSNFEIDISNYKTYFVIITLLGVLIRILPSILSFPGLIGYDMLFYMKSSLYFEKGILISSDRILPILIVYIGTKMMFFLPMSISILILDSVMSILTAIIFSLIIRKIAQLSKINYNIELLSFLSYSMYLVIYPFIVISFFLFSQSVSHLIFGLFLYCFLGYIYSNSKKEKMIYLLFISLSYFLLVFSHPMVAYIVTITVITIEIHYLFRKISKKIIFILLTILIALIGLLIFITYFNSFYNKNGINILNTKFILDRIQVSGYTVALERGKNASTWFKLLNKIFSTIISRLLNAILDTVGIFVLILFITFNIRQLNILKEKLRLFFIYGSIISIILIFGDFTIWFLPSRWNLILILILYPLIIFGIYNFLIIICYNLNNFIQTSKLTKSKVYLSNFKGIKVVLFLLVFFMSIPSIYTGYSGYVESPLIDKNIVHSLNEGLDILLKFDKLDRKSYSFNIINIDRLYIRGVKHYLEYILFDLNLIFKYDKNLFQILIIKFDENILNNNIETYNGFTKISEHNHYFLFIKNSIMDKITK